MSRVVDIKTVISDIKINFIFFVLDTVNVVLEAVETITKDGAEKAGLVFVSGGFHFSCI